MRNSIKAPQINIQHLLLFIIKLSSTCYFILEIIEQFSYREFIINLIECESCGENTMITGSKHKCSYVHVWFGQTILELHLMPDNVVEERSRCCKAWWIVWERCLLLFPSFISAKIIMHDKITKTSMRESRVHMSDKFKFSDFRWTESMFFHKVRLYLWQCNICEPIIGTYFIILTLFVVSTYLHNRL